MLVLPRTWGEVAFYAACLWLGVGILVCLNLARLPKDHQ